MADFAGGGASIGTFESGVGGFIGGMQQQEQLNTNQAEAAQRAQFNALAIQEQQQKIDDQKREEEIAQQNQQMFADLAKGGQTLPDPNAPGMDVGTNPGDPFRKAGMAYLGAGLPEIGLKYIKAGNDADITQANLNKDKVQTQNTALKNRLAQTDVVSQAMFGVTDQASQDAAWANIKSSGLFNPDDINKMASIPYSPEHIKWLQDQTITAAQRATLSAHAATTDATKEEYKSRDAHRKAMEDLDAKKQQDLEDWRAKQQKVGAVAATPKPADIDFTIGQIKDSAFFNGKTLTSSDKQAIIKAAPLIAIRANELTTSNRGLDKNTATQRAIIEAQADGGFFTDKKGTTVFNRWGKTPETARALPMITPKPGQGTTKVDTSKLRPGNYYITAKGTGQWDGKVFHPVKQP